MKDLFAKIMETDLKQQGNQFNLTKTKSVISAFVAKPFLYKKKLGKRRVFSVSKSLEIAK